MKNPVPVTRFDPIKPRDFSTMKVGPYTVRRAPLPGTYYTLYSTMLPTDPPQVAGRQISFPDESDCARHISSRSRPAAQVAASALLDTQLHRSIVLALRTKEMDTRQLCSTFGLVSTAMAPVLSMLISNDQVIRRGTARRPLFAASWP